MRSHLRSMHQSRSVALSHGSASSAPRALPVLGVGRLGLLLVGVRPGAIFGRVHRLPVGLIGRREFPVRPHKETTPKGPEMLGFPTLRDPYGGRGRGYSLYLPVEQGIRRRTTETGSPWTASPTIPPALMPARAAPDLQPPPAAECPDGHRASRPRACLAARQRAPSRGAACWLEGGCAGGVWSQAHPYRPHRWRVRPVAGRRRARPGPLGGAARARPAGSAHRNAATASGGRGRRYERYSAGTARLLAGLVSCLDRHSTRPPPPRGRSAASSASAVSSGYTSRPETCIAKARMCLERFAGSSTVAFVHL